MNPKTGQRLKADLDTLWIEFDAYKSWTHLVNYVENVLQNFGEKYKIIFG